MVYCTLGEKGVTFEFEVAGMSLTLIPKGFGLRG